MQNARRAKLIEGSVGPILFKLTVPMVFGILGMVLFNLVDTFFVGQLGTHQLAALTFTFPVVLVVGSLALGLGSGAAAVISRAIGEGDHTKVQRLTTDSLVLALLIVLLFVIVGFITITPMFTLLGASPEVMPYIYEYMVIWYAGTLFIVVPMVGNNAIRATGDTTTPSAIMMVAVITNIILDPILIFGVGPIPRLEITGAAIATTISRGITFMVSMWVLYWREEMITFTPPRLADVIASWKEILYIGLPTAGSNLIMPIGLGVITGLTATFGPTAVAAFGVASRIEMFALVVVMALGSVLGPFVGQNLGAGKFDRVLQGVRYAQQFVTVWGVIISILLLFLATPLASLFNDDSIVIETIVLYLWIVPISYGILSILMLNTIVLNVLQKPLHSAGLTLFRMFVLYIPLAYLGSIMIGLAGIFGATMMTNFIGGAIAYIILNQQLKASQAKQEMHITTLPKPVEASSI